MNLKQLKEQVETAIQSAIDCGENPEEVVVSIQIDRDGDSVFTHEDVEVHYDGNGQVSGCVIAGWLEKESQ